MGLAPPKYRQRGLREIMNARAKELGARPFTTLHISRQMLEAAKANEANDPELYQEMLLISTVSFPVLVETLPFTSPPLRVIESVPLPP